MTQQNNRPVREFREANFRISCWENEVEQNGRTVMRPSLALEKSYRRPRTGERVQQVIRLFPSELVACRKVVDDASSFYASPSTEDGADPSASET
jgi:hypothetical protein